MNTKIAIIGAGAAGSFCAAWLLRFLPETEIHVFEAAGRPLRKVAVTGGGRCNFTNSFGETASLAQVYPRGERLMSRCLKEFSSEDTLKWFREAGVPAVLQEKGRYFPASQDARDVVNALLGAIKGAVLHTGWRIVSIKGEKGDFTLTDSSGRNFRADLVVVTTGGMNPMPEFMRELPVETVRPVPSLFSFKLKEDVSELMGLSAYAGVGIAGTQFRAEGPVLFTDWGMSGPAILRLSSHAARHLADCSYQAVLNVNWSRGLKGGLESMSRCGKTVGASPCPGIPLRLWRRLCRIAGVPEGMRWDSADRKTLSRLASVLECNSYHIAGRSPFRKEFVTAGGVALGALNPGNLESKSVPGLYFAGEALDVDAVTGGFNLQAAWSTAYHAAKAIAKANGATV